MMLDHVPLQITDVERLNSFFYINPSLSYIFVHKPIQLKSYKHRCLTHERNICETRYGISYVINNKNSSYILSTKRNILTKEFPFRIQNYKMTVEVRQFRMIIELNAIFFALSLFVLITFATVIGLFHSISCTFLKIKFYVYTKNTPCFHSDFFS